MKTRGLKDKRLKSVVEYSVRWFVDDSVYDSVRCSVADSDYHSVYVPIRNSVYDSVWRYVRNSIARKCLKKLQTP
jgi:hypothetical protein